MFKYVLSVLILVSTSVSFANSKTTAKKRKPAQEASQNLEVVDDTTKSETSTEVPQQKVNWSVGLVHTEFHYTESGMSDDTPLNGMSANVDVPTKYNFNVGGDFEYLTGKGKYTGQTWGGTPLSTDTENTIMTIRGLARFHKTLNETNDLNPYAGLGLRYLTNKDSGYGSYKREVNYTYLPVGAEWVNHRSEKMTAGLAAELDVFVKGTVNTHLGDIDPRLPTVTNSQSSGMGYRLTGNMAWKLQKFTFVVQPYIQHWHVENSDHVYVAALDASLLEPSNNTDMYGIDLAAAF